MYCEEKEGNIIWIIKDFCDPVEITVTDLEGNILEQEFYKCTHTPIFGVDFSDAEQIDKILDRLIKSANKKIYDKCPRKAEIDKIKNNCPNFKPKEY